MAMRTLFDFEIGTTVRDTSVQTYHDIIQEGLVGERQREVLKYLLGHPDSTDSEITIGLGYKDPNRVRPRRKELFDLGIVITIGKRKCSISGREAYQWRLRDNPPDKDEIRLAKILTKRDFNE